MRLLNSNPAMFISSHGESQPENYYRRNLSCNSCSEKYYLLCRQPSPASHITLCPHCGHENTRQVIFKKRKVAKVVNNKIVRIQSANLKDLTKLPVRK